MRNRLAVLIAALTFAVPGAHASTINWSSFSPVDTAPPFDGGPDVNGVSCPTSTFCAAANANDVVFTTSDPTSQTWTATDLSSVAGNSPMRAISCPSASFCAVVDDAGQILTSADPAAGAGSWSAASLPAAIVKPLQINCPTASLCVVGDSHGTLATSAAPAGGASSWTVSSTDSQTDDGTARRITGISCVVNGPCVAVDNGGGIFSSPAPASGNWTLSQIQTKNGLSGVSCPTATECVAAGVQEQGLFVSTNPTGGASAWHLDPITSASARVGYEVINCPSATDCIAGSAGDEEQAFVTGDPTTGTFTDTPQHRPWVNNYVLSCPTTTMCVGTGFDASVNVTTDPAGNVWQLVNVGADNTIQSLACPAANLCVAVDSLERVLRTTTPANPASWTRIGTLNEDNHSPFDFIVCPERNFCLAQFEVSDTGLGEVMTFDPRATRLKTREFDLKGQGNGIDDIACGGHTCVAEGDSFKTFESSTPTKRKSWKVVRPSAAVRMLINPKNVCPSASLCLQPGSTIHVLTAHRGRVKSRSETVGAGASAIGCASVSSCTLVGPDGTTYTTSSPAAGPAAWRTAGTPLALPNGQPVSQLTCASKLCVALAGDDEIAVGSGS